MLDFFALYLPVAGLVLVIVFIVFIDKKSEDEDDKKMRLKQEREIQDEKLDSGSSGQKLDKKITSEAPAPIKPKVNIVLPPPKVQKIESVAPKRGL